MAFSDSLSIPSNTTTKNPSSLDFKLYPMTIRRIEMTFPSGCVGLVGVWFEYQDRQVWPINALGVFKGENQTIVFEPNFEVIDLPHVLTLKGINSDDTFPHTVYVVVDGEFGKDFWLEFMKQAFSGIPS